MTAASSARGCTAAPSERSGTLGSSKATALPAVLLVARLRARPMKVNWPIDLPGNGHWCVAAPAYKARFRLVASRCRAAVEPSGFHRKVSALYIGLPPFPDLSWRERISAANTWLVQRSQTTRSRPGGPDFRLPGCDTGNSTWSRREGQSGRPKRWHDHGIMSTVVGSR